MILNSIYTPENLLTFSTSAKCTCQTNITGKSKVLDVHIETTLKNGLKNWISLLLLIVRVIKHTWKFAHLIQIYKRVQQYSGIYENCLLLFFTLVKLNYFFFLLFTNTIRIVDAYFPSCCKRYLEYIWIIKKKLFFFSRFLWFSSLIKDSKQIS